MENNDINSSETQFSPLPFRTGGWLVDHNFDDIITLWGFKNGTALSRWDTQRVYTPRVGRNDVAFLASGAVINICARLELHCYG